MLSEALIAAVALAVLGCLAVSAMIAAFVQRDYKNFVVGFFAAITFFAVSGISAGVAWSLLHQ